MRFLGHGAAVVLALFMIFMGIQKFAGHNPVFSYLAVSTGLGLFAPVAQHLTGAAEIAAGALLLGGFFKPFLRGLGALLSLAVIGGAIVFHLTPWLGVVAPVAFVEGAAPPFDLETDYVKSPFLFVSALMFFALSALVLISARRKG